MRITEIKKGVSVESPWMRPEKAAAYCDLSRAEFDKRARDVPHAGSGRLKIYHQNVLDRWLTGDLCFAFDPEEQPAPIRIRRGVRGKGRTITNPITGRVLSY